jgi:YHS domain-containing protein
MKKDILKGGREKPQKTCPICHEKIRSDIHGHIPCELCGMGIPNLSLAPKHQAPGGKTLYFCCNRCLSIYKREIMHNKEYIDILKEQRDFGLLDDYDKMIKELIIEHINRKYPIQNGRKKSYKGR